VDLTFQSPMSDDSLIGSRSFESLVHKKWVGRSWVKALNIHVKCIHLICTSNLEQ